MRNALRSLLSCLVTFVVVALVVQLLPHAASTTADSLALLDWRQFGGLLMDTLVVVNGGETYVLNLLANKTSPENLKIKLFKSNTTPAETDVIGTYTESTFTGYASITLTGAAWTVTAGAPSNMAAAAQDFTSSANQTAENAYGYTIESATGGALILSERFTGAPFVIQNLNDAVRLTPQVTMD